MYLTQKIVFYGNLILWIYHIILRESREIFFVSPSCTLTRLKGVDEDAE